MSTTVNRFAETDAPTGAKVAAEIEGATTLRLLEHDGKFFIEVQTLSNGEPQFEIAPETAEVFREFIEAVIA